MRQWLGRVSYSLYLVHLIIGRRIIDLLGHVASRPIGPWTQWMLIVVATAASLGAAQLLYLLVERPSTRLSKRIAKAAKTFKRDPQPTGGML